jgi:hypothetical protein
VTRRGLAASAPARGRELRLSPASVPPRRWQGRGNQRSPTPRCIHGTLDESRVISHLSLAHSLTLGGGYGAHSGGAFVAGFVVGAVALTAAPFAVDRAPYLRDVVRLLPCVHLNQQVNSTTHVPWG